MEDMRKTPVDSIEVVKSATKKESTYTTHQEVFQEVLKIVSHHKLSNVEKSKKITKFVEQCITDEYLKIIMELTKKKQENIEKQAQTESEMTKDVCRKL